MPSGRLASREVIKRRQEGELRASKDRMCRDICYCVDCVVFCVLDWRKTFDLGTAKKGILTLKYGPKDLMLWKRGSAFVSTEDENLWIHCKFMWFESPRPPEMLI